MWPSTRLCCRTTDRSLHACNAAPYICVHVRSLAFRTQPGRDPAFIQSHFHCALSGWCYNRNGSIYFIKNLCVCAALERFKSWSDKQPQNHFTIIEMINASLQDKNSIFPFFHMSLTSPFEAVFSSTHCFNIKLEHKLSIWWCNLVASNHSEASDTVDENTNPNLIEIRLSPHTTNFGAFLCCHSLNCSSDLTVTSLNRAYNGKCWNSDLFNPHMELRDSSLLSCKKCAREVAVSLKKRKKKENHLQCIKTLAFVAEFKNFSCFSIFDNKPSLS